MYQGAGPFSGGRAFLGQSREGPPVYPDGNIKEEECMLTQTEKAQLFCSLHDRAQAFIIPNPWDVGTARLLAPWL